jgi:hypothetical protein
VIRGRKVVKRVDTRVLYGSVGKFKRIAISEAREFATLPGFEQTNNNRQISI